MMPRSRSQPIPSSSSPRLRGYLLPAVAAVVAAGCAHAGGAVAQRPAEAVVKVASDEDYARLRASFDVLPIDDPARAPTRAGLSSFLVEQARRELAAGRPDEAWEVFERLLSLWDPDELRAPRPDPMVATAAAELERAMGRRGAHREVVTLLAVELALRPDDTEALARWNRLMEWLRGGGPSDTCNDKNCEQIIDDLEAATAAFPSPFLVEKLASHYWQRQAGATRLDHEGSDRGGLAQLFATRAVTRSGVELARLYLRVSRPDLALAALGKLSGQPGDDPALRDAIARYLAPDARPLDAVSVAAAFARDPSSRGVAERICVDAARRFPSSVEPQLCVGELAIQQDQITIAVRAFERAIAIAPDKREAWESLARLYQARLAQLVGDERTGELESELRRVEAFHENAKKRFPTEPLHTSLAGALLEVGRGLYNAGRIDDAMRMLARSMSVQPRPDTYEQRALIELKRERGPEAVALYKEALEFVKDHRMEPGQQAYWSAKLHRGLAEAYDQIGQPQDAEDERRKSLAAWDQVIGPRLDPEEVAEAELERGKLLYQLGERDQAVAAFDHAIDVAAERGATYADLLAFLVPRGERVEALDAFHRALGRGAISEYLKVYCSLWIVDLDRRSNQPEDPPAHDFLASVNGGKWYHELARWASGRESDAQLSAHADTPAKRAEADFYLGLRRLSDGRPDDARALFRKVLGSQMMAFFEFDMAAYYLRRPAPARPRSGDALPAHASHGKI